MSEINTVTLLIASVSLFLSLITTYFTFFRPAKLKIFVGPFIIMSRHEPYFIFSIPTTIANQSNQTGIIKRCTLVVTHNDSPQHNYHMLWRSFQKLNSEGTSWIQGDTVSSIAVIAKSTESRNISFSWQHDSKPEMQIKEGTYQLKFYFWSHKSKPISNLKQEIYINAEQANHFNNPDKMNKIIQLSMDNYSNVNELLTSKQVDKLN